MVKVLFCTIVFVLSFSYERLGSAYSHQQLVANADDRKANMNKRAQSTTIFASASCDGSDNSGVPQSEPSETWLAASNRILASSLSTESYYLIWSPGAWKKLITGSAALFLAHTLLATHVHEITTGTWLQGTLSLSQHSVTSNVVLPLLASSCCLIQLGMNALSIGCGGFNSILGPVRPYFMSALVYLTFLRWNTAIKPGHAMLRWAGSTALRWSIALLPEAIDLWNRQNQNSVEERSLVAPDKLMLATVQLDIPAMGCVGCIKSVDHALREIPGVDTATSSLNPGGRGGGQALVRIAADSEADVKAIVEALTTAVSSAGFFGSSVESVNIQQNSL